MEGYGEAVLRPEYLCKEYRHTVALRDVSITIPRRQIYGLIGEKLARGKPPCCEFYAV